MLDLDGGGLLVSACCFGGEHERGDSFGSSLVFKRPGQKLDVVMDRSRVGREDAGFTGSTTDSTVAGSIAAGSSTKGFLKSHMELEREMGGR